MRSLATMSFRVKLVGGVVAAFTVAIILLSQIQLGQINDSLSQLRGCITTMRS